MTAEKDMMGIKALLKRHPVTGFTLICGSKLYDGSHDRRAWYERSIGVDIEPGEGVDCVQDLHEPFGDADFEHVDCCSVLEHVRRPWIVAANIERALVPGGTLLLSVPFIWRYHGYPHDYWRFTHEAVREIFPNIEWRELSYFANGKTVSKAKGYELGDMKCIERCEVIGFGDLR